MAQLLHAYTVVLLAAGHCECQKFGKGHGQQGFGSLSNAKPPFLSQEASS